MTTNRRDRYAFTMIELLIVVAIIGILLAILLPAIGLVGEKKRLVKTRTQLDSLKSAIDLYLGSWARYGVYGTGTHDVVDPISYLNDDTGRPLLTLSESTAMHDVSGTGVGPFENLNGRNATHLRDGWNRPILVQVVNESLPGLADRLRTATVLLRSEGSDASGIADDVVMRGDLDRGQWELVTMTGFGPDGEWLVQDR